MTMEIMSNFIFPLIMAIVPAFMGYIIWILQEQRKESKEYRRLTAEEFVALKDGLKELLLDSIAHAHKVYVLGDEPLTVANFNRVEGIYNAYKKLGGNGGADIMWKEIKNEPLDGGK